MPTTGGTYGLYGLIQPTPPDRFGRRTILLVVAVGVLIRLMMKNSNSDCENTNPTHPYIDRVERVASANTLEQVGRLIAEWSDVSDSRVPLGVTLLGLQNTPHRSQHRDYLQRLERTIYDPMYDTKISLEQAKLYLMDHNLLATHSSPGSME